MLNNDKIISVKDLNLNIYSCDHCSRILEGVTFDIKKGKTLCVIGESGCGKSITAFSIIGLLPETARIESGEIIFHSNKGDIIINSLPEKKMQRIRGSKIAMIYQNPMEALNPVYKVGYQISEVLIQHMGMNRAESKERTLELLNDMGISNPKQRYNEYPHQFSGGMRQRIIIAMAMACNPQLLIADEPTTSLDVTIQAQIFELIIKLKEEHNTSIMLITHDMAVVAELADEVIVLYMGFVVEKGNKQEILCNPKHPYTQALINSILDVGKGKSQVLKIIRGQAPDPYNRPLGCQFLPRCDYCTDRCKEAPPVYDINSSHSVSCWLYEKVYNV